jgi:hypothetical protein
MARSIGLAIAMIALALAAPAARASETEWWVSDGVQDYARSESRGVVVGADGALALGPRTSVARAESAAVIWSLAALKDGSVAAGADRGWILRWTASGGLKPWVRLPVGQVLALAPDGDGLVAGTGPEGLIYRIGARGDTTLVARTGERYVWGLARAGPAASASSPASAWFAATGTRGRLLRVEAGRGGAKATTRIVVDTDESNLISILADGHGGVYAGGDSRGRVIQARADGTLRTLYDAAEDEIRSLALGPDGALYAAAITGSAVSDDSGEPGAAEGPTPVRSAVAGGRAVVYRIVPDSVVVPFWSAPQPFVFALAGRPDGVFAATGNRAGVYRLEREGAASQWLAAPAGQVTALAIGSDGALLAATSNPAALWRLGPDRAERGELLSTVQDARRLARFGRLVWRGEARNSHVELESRSGNTDTPDTTWSAWSGGPAADGGRASASPPGRYFQWKIALSGGNPRIESVEAAWREQNLPPHIDEVVVAPQGQSFREGEIQPRMEPVTQSLAGGQKVEYTLPPATSQRALRELPMWARGLRTVLWRGSDPNGDALHFRVEACLEGGTRWFKIAADLDAPGLTWDTNPIPDGRYRVRVIASDEDANPLGEGRTSEAMSAPFSIDNTPPELTDLSARGERGAASFEGRAADASSTISRIEVAVDDGDWRLVTPDGGMADRPALAFHGRLPELSTGDHTLSVRAVDAAGNLAQRALRVTVPAPR